MRVILVTTWGTACGIAEHAAYLKEAIEGADPDIQIAVEANLHPNAVLARENLDVDWVVLNYHAALHSQWTPTHVQQVQARGGKVMVIYHDTGVPNSDQCKALHAVADCFVIHEPAEDLPGAVYLRQGIPGWSRPADRVYKQRPVLGTLGFPFPWKCFDKLAEITGRLDWELLLLAPHATNEQCAEWRRLNPHTTVYRDFTPREQALALLNTCDATAFTFVCHNTGQSASILQGIAARKPVIALSTCRQFRALFLDPLGACAIRWATTFEDVARALQNVPIQRVDPGIVALAHQDSWEGVGRRYAELLRSI